MSSVQGSYIAIALQRLQRGVCVCCWIVGAALAVQLLVWCVATFMDVRFETLEQKSPEAMVLSPTGATATPLKNFQKPQLSSGPVSLLNPMQVDPNRVPTKHDHLMAKIATLMMGGGTMAMFILLPLMVLGVLLSASTATPGVDKTISAFIWSLIVTLLVLPMGESLGLPWREGSLYSYGYMTYHVDLQLSQDPARWGALQFYSRFAVLPLATIVGLTIVGLRFSFGVSAGLGKEDHRLDPVLEKEAANIKASSLHGGRTGAALKALNAAAPAATEKPTAGDTMQVAEGSMPRRLI